MVLELESFQIFITILIFVDMTAAKPEKLIVRPFKELTTGHITSRSSQ